MRYSSRFIGIAAIFVASAALAQGTITISPIAQMANACDAGTGSACYQLAEKLRFGNDIGKDEPRARRLHERGCSLNEARSCFRLGTMTVRGDGGARDSAGARAAYEKSCSLDNSDGCSAVGSVYVIGVGVPIDMTRAAIAFQKACRLEPSSDYICTKARETASYLPAPTTVAERPRVAQVSASAPRPAGATASASGPDGTQCRAAASVMVEYSTGMIAVLNESPDKNTPSDRAELSEHNAYAARAQIVASQFVSARAPSASEISAMQRSSANQIDALLRRCAEAPPVSSAAATARPNAPAASTTPSPALRLISGRNAFEITSSDPVVGTLRVKYLEF